MVRVFKSFGFLDKFIRCIHYLFFGNSFQININGFFFHQPSINSLAYFRMILCFRCFSTWLLSVCYLLLIKTKKKNTGYTFFDSDAEHRVKTLAYIDDICTILHNFNVYDRMQHHLMQYSMVSNAKFNKNKTKAFSITDILKTHGNNLFNVNRYRFTILLDHRNHSAISVIVLSTIHLNAFFLQDKLLAEFKEQVLIYSKRQLLYRDEPQT